METTTRKEEFETVFSKQQMVELLKMFDLHKTSGKVKYALYIFVSDNNSKWIVDSGASDHMIGNSTLFSTYSPCPRNYKVSIANGERVVVAGIGIIKISNDLYLKDVLHVPQLFINFIKDKVDDV